MVCKQLALAAVAGAWGAATPWKPLSVPAYDEERAKSLLRYSEVAFCNKAAVETWACGHLCEEVQAVPGGIRFIGPGEKQGVQGFVAELGDQNCVVSFRGSISIWNWLTDAEMFQIQWPPYGEVPWCTGCMAHSGFSWAWEELREETLKAIDELSCESNVTVTGHSLGAAVATLASFDIRAAVGGDVRVETMVFGKPRVGNWAFVDAYEALAQKQGVYPPLWRVNYYHDPVVRLAPSKWSGSEWGHEYMEVYYTNRQCSEYLVCPSERHSENKTCAFAKPAWQCINTDHINYMNQSQAFKTFDDQCKHAPAESVSV